MVTDQDDTMIRAALAPARALEPSEEEIARVIARVRPTPKRSTGPRLAVDWRRLAAPGLTALALLAAGLYSVPVTRAALEDAGGTVGGVFSGWLGGESAEAPGKSLGSGEEAPENLYQEYSSKEPRVIAEAGGYKLYSYIGSAGGLNFEFGHGSNGSFIMGYENVAELGDSPLHVVGPWPVPAGHQGHVPLFGIAARSVRSVELTYKSGPPLRVSGVEGGFVLLAEPSRTPVEVIALDAEGKELGREPIDYPLVIEPEAPPPGTEGGGRGPSGSPEP